MSYEKTSEFVSIGHPDKCADAISDAILDEYLKHDKKTRAGIEVFLTDDTMIIGGEVKSSKNIDILKIKEIAKNTLKKIGYNENYFFNKDYRTCPDELNIQVLIKEQSSDINQAVENIETNSGDQGIMFGYATCETDNFMPAALEFSKLICKDLYGYSIEENSNIGIDIKTQVTVDYITKENFNNGVVGFIKEIIVSVPTFLPHFNLEQFVKLRIENWSGIDKKLLKNTVYKINPSKIYEKHSFKFDAGLTGRKLIVDSFGGYSPIGGGAQSGKDYSKMDRAGLYAARYIAKIIVASKISKRCTVGLSFSIGEAKPTSLIIDTHGTSIINEDILIKIFLDNYDLTPDWINKRFNLDSLENINLSYLYISQNGQVGDEKYPWEKIECNKKVNNFVINL